MLRAVRRGTRQQEPLPCTGKPGQAWQGACTGSAAPAGIMRSIISQVQQEQQAGISACRAADSASSCHCPVVGTGWGGETSFPHSHPETSPIRGKASLQMLYDERSMGPTLKYDRQELGIYNFVPGLCRRSAADGGAALSSPSSQASHRVPTNARTLLCWLTWQRPSPMQHLVKPALSKRLTRAWHHWACLALPRVLLSC